MKYRVDPRGDREMLEGCPLLKKVAGRKFVPVGLHLGRYTGKRFLVYCVAKQRSKNIRAARSRGLSI